MAEQSPPLWGELEDEEGACLVIGPASGANGGPRPVDAFAILGVVEAHRGAAIWLTESQIEALRDIIEAALHGYAPQL